MTTHDPVQHPRHYTSHPSGVECIEIVEALPFCLGNAVKYIWRAGQKEGASREEDLRKALWYLERHVRIADYKKDFMRSGVWIAYSDCFEVINAEPPNSLLRGILESLTTHTGVSQEYTDHLRKELRVNHG